METNRSRPADELRDDGPRGLTGSFALGYLLGFVLLGALIWYAGIWDVLAKTRLLDLLIRSSVVKLHDRDSGWIEGIPDPLLYLQSQDPIHWRLVGLTIGIWLVISLLKAVQFDGICRFCGIKGTIGHHMRAYFYGLGISHLLPFHIANVATVTALEGQGASFEGAKLTLLIARLFTLFEIAFYALLALLWIGWTTWLMQIGWALVILGVAFWFVQPRPAPAARGANIPRAGRRLLGALAQQPGLLVRLALLSLVSFQLRDVAAYVISAAFTGEHVLLGVRASVLLMGVVAGYIARLVAVTPGGIGQGEWGTFAALHVAGVPPAEAATIALLIGSVRYLSVIFLWGVVVLGYGIETNLRRVLELFSASWKSATAAVDRGEVPIAETDGAELPSVPLAPAPDGVALWRRSLCLTWLIAASFFLNEAARLCGDYWLLGELGLANVFWINFRIGVLLFLLTALVFAAAIATPAFAHALPREARRGAVQFGALFGLLAGYLLALRYQEFLLAFHGQPFGKRDPVFGRDIGFYVFVLPAIWTTWTALFWAAALTLVASIAAAHAAHGTQPTEPFRRLPAFLAVAATPYTVAALVVLGGLAALAAWLSRYNLLYRDNSDSSIYAGAEYLDVCGFFSTLNGYTLSALLLLGVTAAIAVMLHTLHRTVISAGGVEWQRPLRKVVCFAGCLVALDFSFHAGIYLRDRLVVAPNEPVVQLPYIQRHVDATRAAYGLDRVEQVRFVPNGPGDPVPAADELLRTTAMKNVPLWPGFMSRLDRLVDPHHAERVLRTQGDAVIYGVTRDAFWQQQKLRPYYDFLDVDTVRYTVGGEPRLFASAVREVPLARPLPWLASWSQEFLLYTHGHGLVLSPVGEADPAGNPVYHLSGIPSRPVTQELALTNEAVYYGEGSATMAFTNARQVPEFDRPTDEGWTASVLPPDEGRGVRLDSLLKRAVMAFLSREPFNVAFSRLITANSRAHYYRTPIERLEFVAPFLHYDGDAYAVVADGCIIWMVNAMTTTDQYPYSRREFLGLQVDERALAPRPGRRVNYVEDSVKATIDAYTGEVRLYAFSDGPIISTWARIYPSLFSSREKMPPSHREQVQYSAELFHLQFDDIYVRYQMSDALTFFAAEDLWDDGNEVLGAIMDEGKAITFSIKPYYWIAETGNGVLPGGRRQSQFVQSMLFTPKMALNLRAVPIVYQEGEEYGRLVVLQIPKGQYVMGPEQAEAAIDQDPIISQYITLWNRLGNQVIRGHTTGLVIGNELIYIEPLFIRSRQNPVSQLKRVVVVFREQVAMGTTLPEALRAAVDRATEAASGSKKSRPAPVILPEKGQLAALPPG